MANPASVSDLLAVLELSSTSGDTDLADQLRHRFGIAPAVDLVSALGALPPAEVLSARTSAAAPVAAMVRDLYAWLGQLADVRSTANLSVQVTDAQMRTMNLDPAHYKAYECTVVEEALRIEFDPSHLPPTSPLLHLSDAHWKPGCLDNATPKSRCRNCHSRVAENFRELEALLHSAVAAMPSTEDWPDEFSLDRRGPFFTNLPESLPRVTAPESRKGDCRYGQQFFAD